MRSQCWINLSPNWGFDRLPVNSRTAWFSMF
jgi:hypothetical protein